MHGDASLLTSFWIPGVVSWRSAAKFFLSLKAGVVCVCVLAEMKKKLLKIEEGL
jgi:hypothetical protein